MLIETNKLTPWTIEMALSRLVQTAAPTDDFQQVTSDLDYNHADVDDQIQERGEKLAGKLLDGINGNTVGSMNSADDHVDDEYIDDKSDDDGTDNVDGNLSRKKRDADEKGLKKDMKHFFKHLMKYNGNHGHYGHYGHQGGHYGHQGGYYDHHGHYVSAPHHHHHHGGGIMGAIGHYNNHHNPIAHYQNPHNYAHMQGQVPIAYPPPGYPTNTAYPYQG